MTADPALAAPLETFSRRDVGRVGGKNASLGEMLGALGGAGVRVPGGFATTADAFRLFTRTNGLDRLAAEALAKLERGEETLERTGAAIRAAFLAADPPPALAEAIRAAYADLCAREGVPDLPVAVRSSATAEDLPDASFAGQQETFLNVCGEAAVLDACRRCYASLYTDRAIAYRRMKGFDRVEVALSVGVQRMVRADEGGSGVMFTLDTESGFDRVVLVDAVWGLGETIVQGASTPDEHQVFKPLLDRADLSPIVSRRLGAKERRMSLRPDGTPQTGPTPPGDRARFVLSDAEALELARTAVTIEAHYGVPMDIEWARDGRDGALFIVQARPETVQSRAAAGALRTWKIGRKGPRLLTGLGVGEGVAAGPVQRIDDPRDIARFRDGSVLVTSTTDPDWVPVMKRAAAIVTDHGGRTSHAAIVSRELGLPAVVGAGYATEILQEGEPVTVSCAEGDQGFVYEGVAEFEARDLSVEDLPKTRSHVMLNLADPSAAFRWWRLPADGVGLARMEFVISNHVRVHPMALCRPEKVSDPETREKLAELTRGFDDPRDYFIETLAGGLARIAAVLHPRPVVIRMSDFKTNEYAHLLGGADFEPEEENPMIGFRGASRYYSADYREGFALECRAIRLLREEIGFDNVVVMIPFCRTVPEADRVLAEMAANGLRRGRAGLKVWMMCEIPSNVILAEDFATRFDGFSIGSNDLTQLTLGVDRDSDRLAGLFDARDPAVTWMIRTVIAKAHAAGVEVSFCGQAPSDDPAYARLLVEAGIDGLSVSPDSFLNVKRLVAEAEAGRAPA
ncbi:phosphoenolpyruvate synthase [Albimonas sp. CAU 1670]|uniref:phosphoenolpyruvate synthase n=1 Tax=Albimonas sp. CAU 1670 TaxID=3032599 RepID=UPI0023DB2E9F|nr:phosphoenolpyruvate synthase [Albimonas sp. CAU 1670]MDF2231823.1 phosphoenolpyruvate synthase [Albimonas sp. CAU 1670]